jgi:hypothetical protein
VAFIVILSLDVNRSSRVMPGDTLFEKIAMRFGLARNALNFIADVYLRFSRRRPFAFHARHAHPRNCSRCTYPFFPAAGPPCPIRIRKAAQSTPR